MLRERSLFRAGDGVEDIREGLWIFGKCWRRGYAISTEKKGGVIEINEHLIHSKEYGITWVRCPGIGLLCLRRSSRESSSHINTDYFQEAANWLSHHPKVLPHSIGIHAICYGSWIALLMESLNMKAVKTVVAIFPKISVYVKPFTYKGNISEVIPFDYSKRIPTEEGYIWRDGDYSKVGEYNAAHAQHSAITPVEYISCPVLLVYETDDLFTNPEFAVKMVHDGLNRRGRENLCSVLCYSGAGHLIKPPYTPFCCASYLKHGVRILGDSHFVWGGEMKSHARAQEDAWPKILSFLRRNLQNIKCNL